MAAASVFTLLVRLGRCPGDGLPEGATGGALLCYASGRDEAEAVRETAAVLRRADLAPLDVSSYGTLEERLAEGHDIDEDERALMARALAEDAVIVAQSTPFFEGDEEAAGHDGDGADDGTDDRTDGGPAGVCGDGPGPEGGAARRRRPRRGAR